MFSYLIKNATITITTSTEVTESSAIHLKEIITNDSILENNIIIDITGVINNKSNERISKINY